MRRFPQAPSRLNGPITPISATLLLALTFLGLPAACGRAADPVAFEVGTRVVTLPELESSFWEHVRADSAARPDSASLHRFVKSEVQRILIEQVAEKEEPELEPARKERTDEFREGLYVETLRAESYGDAYKVPERDVKAAWERLGRRLHLRYLLLDTRGDAEQTRQAIQEGAILSRIAPEKSLDPASRANGGDVGWLSYLDLDPTVRDIVFSLPVGGLSPVIPWGDNFQIFQVAEEQPNEGRGPIEEERARLEQGLQVVAVRRATEAYKQSLLDKYHFKLDPAEVAWLTVLMRDRTAGVNRGERLDELGAGEDGVSRAMTGKIPWEGMPVPAVDTARVVATFDPPGGLVKPLLVFDQLFAHPMPTWPRFESGNDVETLVRELVLERLEIREAMARKIDQRPEIVRKAENQVRQVRARQFIRNKIRPKLRPSEEELLAFYQSHLGEFSQPERRRFVAVNLPDLTRARRAAELLRAGKATAEVRMQVAPGDTLFRTTGEAGTPEMTYGSSPMLDPVLFSLPLHGVSDPIPVGNTFTVAKVIEILPHTETPFEEVKTQIQSRMVDARLGPRLKSLADGARGESPVRIDWKVVDRARLRPPA